MRPDESVVRAEGLSRRFTGPDGRPLVALDRVSLSVPRGQLTALVGPDGAGKTTLMRMMAGLLAPDEGSLHVLGLDVTRNAQAVQDRISYMPQRFGLYEDLSVQENLDLYADLHGVPQAVRRERFARLMAMTDLARFTARPAGKLSGGMKQKLGLACTLVRSPELLLLDEPSVGVDPLSRRDLWEILLQLVRDEQLSVVVSTAYMDEAERCAHVHVMNAGHVLANGTPQALAQRAQGLTFVATPPVGMAARMLQARLLDAVSTVVDAVPRGGRVRFIRGRMSMKRRCSRCWRTWRCIPDQPSWRMPHADAAPARRGGRWAIVFGRAACGRSRSHPARIVERCSDGPREKAASSCEAAGSVRGISTPE